MWRPALFQPRAMGISDPSEDRAIKPGQKKRERATPMLARRIIVAAFAAIAILGIFPLAFPSDQDLFRDTPAAFLTSAAAGVSLN
jgi:hypothetical protein